MEDIDNNRLALITSGAGSFGKASAMELARRGWSIFLQHFGPAADADAACEAVQQAAAEAGKEILVTAKAADLALAAGREELVEQALDEFGRLDMLVNCPQPKALPASDLLELTEDEYLEALRLGPMPTFFLTQLVANEMVRLVESGDIESPRIVTVSTIGAYTTAADQGLACLCAAESAMATQLFADRLGEHGINVYEIRMGIIAAGAGDAAHARYDQLISSGLTPIRRWGRPGDIARAVAAVAEDLLSFSTGEIINVDGGFHLRRM